MTIRWKVGKKPTQKDFEHVISNALPNFKLERTEVAKIAERILKFVNDRVEGRT